MSNTAPVVRASCPCLLLTVLLLSTTGCLYTKPMWQAANNKSVSEPRPYAVIERSPTDRVLVIDYDLNSTDTFYTT
ncbi:MAG TPA: hypothetical protein VF669_21360, partial [Tepidisphaeraceae bacterium]